MQLAEELRATFIQKMTELGFIKPNGDIYSFTKAGHRYLTARHELKFVNFMYSPNDLWLITDMLEGTQRHQWYYIKLDDPRFCEYVLATADFFGVDLSNKSTEINDDEWVEI